MFFFAKISEVYFNRNVLSTINGLTVLHIINNIIWFILIITITS